jgi:hypothetical protein
MNRQIVRSHGMPRLKSKVLGMSVAASLFVAACGTEGPPSGLEPEVLPPLNGTAFIDPDIITAADTTTFVSLVSMGQGSRVMFDRRADDFVTLEAHLFDATFDDGLMAEIQVNPEFDSISALAEAEEYAVVIGRLPTALRADLETVWIHAGVELFGGGNNNLLIHTGQAAIYLNAGFLEEVLVHEAVHTSLDAAHAAATGWLAAQDADQVFISGNARDSPNNEDLAEAFGAWLAVRHRSDRITSFLGAIITTAIPARLDYLDAQNFDLYPVN